KRISSSRRRRQITPDAPLPPRPAAGDPPPPPPPPPPPARRPPEGGRAPARRARRGGSGGGGGGGGGAAGRPTPGRAPTAAPRAVLPIEGTTRARVPPSRASWPSRWAAPRILNDPPGARNSHLAWTSRPGKRFPSRTSGVRTRGSTVVLGARACR